MQGSELDRGRKMNSEWPFFLGRSRAGRIGTLYAWNVRVLHRDTCSAPAASRATRRTIDLIAVKARKMTKIGERPVLIYGAVEALTTGAIVACTRCRPNLAEAHEKAKGMLA